MKAILRGVVLACLSLLGAQWGMGPGPGLGSSAPASPVIRGSGITTNSLSSITIALPTGSVAGDFDLLLYGDQSGHTPSPPAGWTLVISAGAVVAQQDVWSKTLSSGDISTGSVTVGVPTGGNNTLGIVGFIGGTGGVREADLVNGADPATVTTSSGVLAGDVAIYFGTWNFGATSAPTVNRGTSLQSIVSGGNAGAIYDELLASGGAQSAIYTLGSSVASAATIIVKP